MKLIKPAIAVLLVLATGHLHAQWSPLSDFETLNLGPVGGQGGWTTTTGTGNAAYAVAADPANPANKALLATGFNENAYIPLGASAIADGTTGTLFFRMRTSDLSDLVFGSSDVAAPAGFGDYEGYMVMGVNGAPAVNTWKVRAGAGFANFEAYAADTWYNVWVVLDNAADTNSLYISQGSGAATLLGSGAFRNGTADPLVSLNLRMGASHNTNNAQGYLDDIYVDKSGQNLAIPSGIGSVALPGDVNLNGVVDINDYFLIRDHFRQAVADPKLGDLTGPSSVRDGIVDFYDFAEWKANAPPQAVALALGLPVPEPGSLTLLVGTAFVLAIRRRSR
ncbi:hypothetical protein Pla175_22770 [Pirellulimonas nuda]|uniref:PEP-CTERM protein-sorting domain-containing protein n=1 Tax=Pirellulimonas nuda TaxID=2528009 RepID=A0A518DBQ6_9BACT|nr:hypothetical protein [Pirellulimonas nuda]QDU88893.1 hypothetical protein Pla175_22770 [Pirellulimonas nuda]